MTTPDTAYTLAQALLGRIMVRLTDADVAPGLSFVYDGPVLPADDCCQGLLWARLVQIEPTDGSGDPYKTQRNVGVPVPGWLITLEVGILRCIPEINEQGLAPSPDEYNAASLMAAFDRQQIRAAIMTDFLQDVRGNDCDALAPGPWIPADAGGCAGGFTTVAIVTTLSM